MKTSYALAAKSIKAELTTAFPGTKFSVKSEGYSMGDSVRVYWTNGPTTEQVEKIANKYQEGDFDGMNDIYEYDHDRPETNGSAKYVFCERSVDSFDSMVAAYCDLQKIEYNEPTWNLYDGYERVDSIVRKIASKHSVPCGHQIIGLCRTDCNCGSIQDFYRPVTAIPA